MNDTIDVNISIQDETGGPISYATVWSAIEFDKQHVKDEGIFQFLNLSDLWRISERYGALHDIVARYGDKPVATLRVPIMGSANGLFQEVLSYKNETGKGNNYARPDQLRIGYTFFKHGYFPGRVEFTVPKSQSRIEATVVLRRNLNDALETQPYLQTFARLRYQLSNTRSNLTQTLENKKRLDDLRAALEQAAQQAIEAGDKKSAARIYARMRYLPSLIVINGQTAGYDQGDANSPEAQRAMDMAYQLDPDNLYVWMQTYLRRMQLPPNPTREQRASAALKEVEKLIAAKGERAVWPMILAARAGGYAVLGDYAKARELYLEAAKIEPKYDDWSRQIEDMKLQMKLKGVPIPPDWS